MKARRHSLAVSAGITCSLVIAGAWLSFDPARADDTAASTSAPGAWQSHKYSFQFMGFTSTYSCDGLADKLKVLLLAAGARSDVKSQPGACAAGFGRPDKFARADLTFSTLAPVQGDAASDAKPVNGVWRTVAFSSHSPRDLRDRRLRAGRAVPLAGIADVHHAQHRQQHDLHSIPGVGLDHRSQIRGVRAGSGGQALTASRASAGFQNRPPRSSVPMRMNSAFSQRVNASMAGFGRRCRLRSR